MCDCHQKKAALGQNDNGNSKRKQSVFVCNICRAYFPFVACSRKVYYSSQEKEIFLSVSKYANHTPCWQKLPSTLCSVMCKACNCTLHQEQNVWQYRNLGKGLAGQELGLAKPQLDPALGKPLLSF